VKPTDVDVKNPIVIVCLLQLKRSSLSKISFAVVQTSNLLFCKMTWDIVLHASFLPVYIHVEILVSLADEQSAALQSKHNVIAIHLFSQIIKKSSLRKRDCCKIKHEVKIWYMNKWNKINRRYWDKQRNINSLVTRLSGIPRIGLL
jgi:hypothetical protein